MSASSPLQIEAQENLSPFISSRPQAFKLTNLTNSQPCDITALQARIHDLQGKVRQLQQRLSTKRKRNRRKSSEVDKRHKCEECKKQYGSIVSLNLHQRIKHRRTKIEQQEA